MAILRWLKSVCHPLPQLLILLYRTGPTSDYLMEVISYLTGRETNKAPQPWSPPAWHLSMVTPYFSKMTGVRLYYKHLSSAYFAFEVEMLTFLEAKYQILHLTRWNEKKGGRRYKIVSIVSAIKVSEVLEVPLWSRQPDYVLYNFKVEYQWMVSSVEKVHRHQKYIIILYWLTKCTSTMKNIKP